MINKQINVMTHFDVIFLEKKSWKDALKMYNILSVIFAIHLCAKDTKIHIDKVRHRKSTKYEWIKWHTYETFSFVILYQGRKYIYIFLRYL